MKNSQEQFDQTFSNVFKRWSGTMKDQEQFDQWWFHGGQDVAEGVYGDWLEDKFKDKDWVKQKFFEYYGYREFQLHEDLDESSENNFFFYMMEEMAKRDGVHLKEKGA
jgi:hypothetical protein